MVFFLTLNSKRDETPAPILWTVVHAIPNVRVKYLSGKRVHAHGHFEFILTRGTKRVCIMIIEAKKEQFEQGLAQSLLGYEAAVDLDNPQEPYGVVTNFENWFFFFKESTHEDTYR